ncbi:hypothetical protein VTK26DRAFT_752 [Humicola hyalothermophila]
MEEQRPRTARGGSGLRPPPGFENLAPRRDLDAGEVSEPSPPTATGAVYGIFPFPSPFPTSSSSSSSSTTSPSGSKTSSNFARALSEYHAREKMESSTNAWFTGHHHAAMVAVMKKKFQEILDYDKTKNRKILHLDWVAANPTDPANQKDAAPIGGLGYEERQLSNSVARCVMRITHEVEDWDPRVGWNRTMLYGDWLHDRKGLRQYFVEFQIKRISGADEELLELSGIDPNAVWLSLHDENAPAIEPAKLPAPPPTFRALPNPPMVGMSTNAEVDRAPAPAPVPASASSLEVPTSSTDKGKGKAVSEAQVDNDDSPAPRSALDLDREQVTINEPTSSADSAQPPAHPSKLDQLADIALSTGNAGAAAVTSAAANEEDETPPRIGIPHSQPLPTTGSFDSLNPPAEEDARPASASSTLSTDSTDESLNEGGQDPTHGEQHPIYLAGEAASSSARSDYSVMTPADQLPMRSAAQLAAYQAEWERCFAAKEAEIAQRYRFNADPAFLERRRKSFVYAVRVVAIPDRGHVTNVFTGPPAKDRYGTLIAQGGWVVPPLEERVARRDQHRRAYRNKGAKPGKYEGPPYPRIDCAVPCRFDWSGDQMPRYFGQAAPVWREPAEPCLEDVYWMVWQLLAGRQFVGFNPGAGFGASRSDIAGNKELLDQCPFKSPSTEALYHAASYPRPREIQDPKVST